MAGILNVLMAFRSRLPFQENAGKTLSGSSAEYPKSVGIQNLDEGPDLPLHMTKTIRSTGFIVLPCRFNATTGLPSAPVTNLTRQL